MKKIFVILICCFLLVCSCTDKNERGTFNFDDYNSIPAQEWFDKHISHSTVTDSTGHTIILHEYGSRNNVYGDYSFSIEHTPECKKCCEIYD